MVAEFIDGGVVEDLDRRRRTSGDGHVVEVYELRLYRRSCDAPRLEQIEARTEEHAVGAAIERLKVVSVVELHRGGELLCRCERHQGPEAYARRTRAQNRSRGARSGWARRKATAH
jgi:hypothetical protein